MSTRRFSTDYQEDASLRDGSPVVFRLVRADDKQRLADGLGRMSPESRYRRFFSHRERLSPEELAYLTELDQETHFALAAGRPATSDGELGLGVARFVVLDDATPIDGPTGAHIRVAEAAIAVVDEAQGLGLGRMLFERLVMAAAERDVGAFRFDVLAENDSMLGLVKSIFPEASSQVVEGIMTIDCPIPDFSAHVPGERPEGALYRLMKLAAEGAVRILRRASERDTSALLKAGATKDGHDLSELIGLTDEDGP